MSYLTFFLYFFLNACFSAFMIYIIIKNLKEIQELQKEKKQAIMKMNEAILEFDKSEKEGVNNNEDTFD